MEEVATLGTLDPQHAITQFVKALADPARAFAFVHWWRLISGVVGLGARNEKPRLFRAGASGWEYIRPKS